MARTFAQLLAEWSAEAIIIVLALVIFAFLLGLLCAWWLNNIRLRQTTEALEHKNNELSISNTERQNLQESCSLLTADLKRINFELEEAKVARRQAETENLQLNQTLNETQRASEKAEATIRHYLTTIEDLNDQIIGLKARIAQLSAQQEVKSSGKQASAAFRSVIGNFAEERLSEIEQRLQQLEQSKEPALRLPKTDAAARTLSSNLTESEITFSEHPEEEAQEEIFTPVQFSFLANEPTNSRSAVFTDDLTRIEGIGPFLQKKLHALGIYTYQDISTWDDAQIEAITRDLEFFEGRIQKDDWVGQARKLAEQPIENAAANNITAGSNNDLKIVEGIGPAIEEILYKAGITTFKDLAQSDPNELETIIQIAAPHMHFISAATWPAQARLAMNDEWEVLRDYQNQLAAGRPTKDEDEG